MSKRQSGRNIHGILLLDKRLGVSSNKALQEVRRLYNANKAGHTGSLDPLATGLLPICFGEATKVSGMLLDDNKRYQVLIQLGIKTDSGDLEGNIIETKPVPEITSADLATVLARFTGDIDQVPPMYSALKHAGKKLYELARAGQTVEREARRVSIFDLRLIEYRDDHLKLEVYCSKGTYIRSLAEDIGESIGCCATVKTLRRLEVGSFSLEQAFTLTQLQQCDDSQLLDKLINVDMPLANLPKVRLDETQTSRIMQGQALKLDESGSGKVRMYCAETFLGLGEIDLNGKLLPKKLFLLNN
jgi:tRNA pseudouridine55 synthase